MRTKIVEFEGQSFTISPLMTEQYREYALEIDQVRNAKPAEQLTAEERDKYYGRMVKTVAISLANAQGDNDEVRDGHRPLSRAWTPERVNKEVEWGAMNHIHANVLEMSGLKIDDPQPGKKNDAHTQ